jgi:dihydrofolate reductase
MRKIVVVTYLSLDGVMEQPAWSMPYWGEELWNFQRENLFCSDALLLGRTTYEEFKQVWSSRTDEAGFADRMNSMPKFVVTSSTAAPEWNATFITGDIPGEITKLKDQPGQDILVNGSGRLCELLRRNMLIDEYRLMVFPVVVGHGRRLFSEDAATTLELAETMATDKGVMVSTYRPVAEGVETPTEG